MLAQRLVISVGIVVVGLVVAALLPTAEEIRGSDTFFLVASALLAVGLLGSTSSISIVELQATWRIVLVAVTVGVLLKAALITAVMYAVFRDPAYLVLGVALAQIDPLSVAALQGSSRLSERGRAVLAAWSSFDDPVTTVLVLIMAGVAVRAGAETSDNARVLVDPVSGLVGNVVVAVAAAGAWLLLKLIPGRPTETRRATLPWLVAGVAGLVVLLLTSFLGFWMLGLAVAGLFFRPLKNTKVLEGATTLAFVVALFLLGFVVAAGADLGQGIALGVTAYGAQIVVGYAVAWRLPDDRLRLALSQQSGITAVVLALLLEQAVKGTVGIVAPAILVVNVLHLVCNGAVERHHRRRRGRGNRRDDDEPAGAPPGVESAA